MLCMFWAGCRPTGAGVGFEQQLPFDVTQQTAAAHVASAQCSASVWLGYGYAITDHILVTVVCSTSLAAEMDIQVAERTRKEG